jgi:DnaK suppressor protein
MQCRAFARRRGAARGRSRAQAPEGAYGICVDCGGEIGFGRLQAEPAAARCVECQARHEKIYRR